MVPRVAHSLLVARARFVGFVWGFTEASIFFVLPDFFIAPAIIAKPQRVWRLVAAVTAGSLLGAIFMLMCISMFPAATKTFIAALPFTDAAMLTSAGAMVTDTTKVFLQPFSGIPMKAWLWSAVNAGVSLVPFVIVLMFGRLFRFVGVALVALVIERFFGKTLRRYAVVFGLLYVIIFFVSLALVSY